MEMRGKNEKETGPKSRKRIFFKTTNLFNHIDAVDNDAMKHTGASGNMYKGMLLRLIMIDIYRK
jgi:hypothetical protein